MEAAAAAEVDHAAEEPLSDCSGEVGDEIESQERGKDQHNKGRAINYKPNDYKESYNKSSMQKRDL